VYFCEKKTLDKVVDICNNKNKKSDNDYHYKLRPDGFTCKTSNIRVKLVRDDEGVKTE